MIRFLLILFLSTISAGVIEQASGSKDYPLDYFYSPVSNEIRLSGTFGELRPNHLHAGIDIKALNGRTGQSIFASASGFVSRINVNSGGYGKALYIDHPNGYTSVYAHLQNFSSEIEEYIKRKQYEKEQFELTVYPDSSMFNFNQGDEIGKLGLSGRSFGPHLHFEIRDSNTEEPINPLLFGLKIIDKVRPNIKGIKVYGLDDKNELILDQTELVKGHSLRHSLRQGDTLSIPFEKVGFAIETYDQMNDVSNMNGVFSIEMLVDDSLYYSFEMEKFSFRESRYINAHLDYEEQVSNKDYFNRCYSMPGNKLSIYKKKTNSGVIELPAKNKKHVQFIIKDALENKSELNFWLKRSESKKQNSKTYNYKLLYAEENKIISPDLELYFPKACIYENLYLEYSSSTDTSHNIYSAVQHIHNRNTPVHTWYDISIRSINLPDFLKGKAFIASCNKDGQYMNCGGKWENGLLKTKVKTLGDFCIKTDSIAPTIEVVSFPRNMKTQSSFSFKIKDNFPTARNVKGLSYRGSIDGKWVLMEFDAKKDLLTHTIDSELEIGLHQFELRLEDAMGNIRLFRREFSI